jgi:mannose-1-phosphate guanylyltransferase
MADRTLVVCILAGGSGTRLYPASRSFRPKPFLLFNSEQSLLEQTVERVTCADETIILTRDEFRENVEACVTDETVLVEPASKDTGPALTYATWRIQEKYDNPVIVALPSNHYVSNDGKFSTEIERAATLAAETDKLVTLGIDPTRPATEYGYMLPESAGKSSYVEQFLEKPDKETAQKLIEDGALWNAGIFAWTPERFLQEAADTPLDPLLRGLETGNYSVGFESIEPISVDYAVLERATQVYTTRLDVEWDDLGTWDAIGRVFADEAADQDDIAVDETDLLTSNTSDNIIAAPGKHVSLIGIDGLVVAAYDDRILVAPREDSDKLRSIVATLQDEGLF